MLIRRVMVYYTTKEPTVRTVDLRKTRCVGKFTAQYWDFILTLKSLHTVGISFLFSELQY